MKNKLFFENCDQNNYWFVKILHLGSMINYNFSLFDDICEVFEDELTWEAIGCSMPEFIDNEEICDNLINFEKFGFLGQLSYELDFGNRLKWVYGETLEELHEKALQFKNSEINA